MRPEVKFSSKRFLMTLMLCACSVILLHNNSLPRGTSFLFNLCAMLAGLFVCLLFYLPAAVLRKKRGSDVFLQLDVLCKPLRVLLSVLYTAYFRYVAVFFLLPYTDMFCKKYYPGVSPCLIALLLLLCCVYAALKGVNVISRFSVFLFALAMLTNFLMFGGSVSSLRFHAADFGFHGSMGDFWRSGVYFLTPCFTATLFACFSGSTRRFRLRQPVIAFALTGLKYALVLFFIAFAVGEYALRQEYPAFVLSRTAHFGAFAGVESFYMALATMSVFMIVSLLLCAMCRAFRRGGSRPFTFGFAATVFAAHTLAVCVPAVWTFFASPLLLCAFSLVTAVILPLLLLIPRRKQHA